MYFTAVVMALAGLIPLAQSTPLSGSTNSYDYSLGPERDTGVTTPAQSAGSVAQQAASTVGPSVPGDVQCSRAICVGASIQGDDVQYVVQSTGTSQIGWMAVGFGTAMSNSPMVIMWKNEDGTATLSQRKTGGRSMPLFDPAPAQQVLLSDELTNTVDKQFKFAFTVPMAGDAKPKLIWAYGSDQPSSSDASTATFRQHSSFGRFSLDLNRSENPAVVLESPALSLTMPKKGATGPGGKPPLRRKQKTEMVILAHAVVCAIAFLVIMPAGALLARYMRTFSPQWFKGHWILQFGISAPFVLAGAILAGTIAKVGGPDMDNTHTRVGIVLFVLYAIQCILGGVIHFVKPKDAKRRPIQNYVHAVLGISIIALGFFQVRTGYVTEWPNAVERPTPQAINILWYVWVVFIPLMYFGGLALLKRQFKQEEESRARKATLPPISWNEPKDFTKGFTEFNPNAGYNTTQGYGNQRDLAFGRGGYQA